MRRGRIAVLIAVLVVTLVGAGAADAKMPKLTGPAAKHYMRKSLKLNRNFGYRYAYNKKFRDCKRYSNVRVRCKASWILGDTYYHGPITIWYGRYQGEVYWYDAYRIKRVDTYCQATGGSNCTKTYVDR